MKLWIRSQNKEALANVKNVRFCKMKKCELKETPCTIKEFVASTDAYCVECKGEIFGEYATRERCLEIIDEIQKLLEASNSPNPFLNIERDGFLDYKEITQNVIIYQMPEK